VIIRTLLPALALAGLLTGVAMPASAMPGAAASVTVAQSSPSIEPVYWVWIHHHRVWRRHHYWHHY
jgi:hypothetical protein